MYESMIFGAKNFLRIILKFPKIGLKKLFKNSKYRMDISDRIFFYDKSLPLWKKINRFNIH